METLVSEEVFRCPIFSVTKEKIKLADGREVSYFFIERSPAVVILPIDEKGRLLLTREYSLAYKAYDWRLPAGTVDDGENPQAAAQRELQEEAGVKAGELKLLTKLDKGGNWIRQDIYIFLGTGLAPSKLPGDEPHVIEVHPTSLEKAAEMALNREIKDSEIALAIIGYYQKWQKEK